MSISLFDTRAMITALEQAKPAKSFFLDTFFKETEAHQTKYVDIDIMKGKRRLAPFVNPMHRGKMVAHLGYETKTYTPPYIKPKMITTAANILERQMGETIYAGGKSPEQLAQVQLGKDLATLDEMILRREEWMAAQAILTGQVVVLGEGVSDTITFGMSGTHLPTLTSTDKWDDLTNSQPIEDLEDWAELVIKDSGMPADIIVMGAGAARNFMKNANVQKQLNIWNYSLGRIEPGQIIPGARRLGAINAVSTIWVYHEWYIDDNGVEQPLMPTNKVLLGSTQARTIKHYGAIQDLEANGAVPRFAKSWTEKDPSGQILLVQSAPLPVPHQIDAFLTATVY